MCQHFYNGQPILPMLVNPAPSELTPLPLALINNSLYGLSYTGGFKPFSQYNGYVGVTEQSYTPDSLGLLTGQYFGQPLTVGG